MTCFLASQADNLILPIPKIEVEPATPAPAAGAQQGEKRGNFGAY